MFKRIFVLIILCFFAMSCCGCQQPVHKEYIPSSVSIETPNDLGDVATQFSSILFQTDNKVYYESVSDGTLSIYVYDIAEKTSIKIGDINNFLFSNLSVAETDGKIYFFVTTTNLLGKVNNFYSVDISTNKFKKIYDERLYQTFNYLTSFNGEVYVLKGDMKGNDAVTFIETYNTSSGKRKTVKEVVANHNEKTGEIILNFTCENDKFYVYSQKYINYEIYHYLDVYDGQFNLLESKEFDAEKYFEIFNTAITRIAVKDDKLYMQNLSNAALLEDMSGATESIITDFEKPLWLSYRFSGKAPWILYYRGEPYIYRVDVDGKLQKSDKLNVEGGYSVNMVTQNEDYVAVHFRKGDDSTQEKLMLYKYTDLF